MADEYMKVTYHTQQGTKWNVYISLIQSFEALKVEIEGYLSGDADKRHNFRMYWIDEHTDEIDIVKAVDYSVFLERNKNLRHLHVLSVNDQKDEPKKPENTTSGSPFTNLFPTTARHSLVECDNCKLKPIVGFRYKCVECNNFDLCQRCEAMHCHPEHMMVRMPNNKWPNVIETWMTDRTRRCHKRLNRNQCHFMPSSSDDVPSAAPGGGDTERSHHSRRSHRRRDLNSGLFGHLYTMMQDLAEGGVDYSNESVANAAAAAAAKAADDAATIAAATATTAAAAAAKAASEAFQAAASSQTESEMTMGYNEPIQPTTPPTTPNGAGVPPMSAPSFENVAQVLDPQYMRAGLKILNNFSEMFAKMLDPNDGVGMSCPYAGGAPSADRKNSSTSTTSTENSQLKSNAVDDIEKSATPATPGKDADEEAKKSESEIPSSSISTPPPTSVVIDVNETQMPEEENSPRSQSIEDNEWQLIDKATTSVGNGTEAVTSTTAKSVGQSIDYAQVSKDLKTHIEEENKREKLSKEIQTPPAVSAPIPSATEASNSAETQQARVDDEKRAVLFYHADPRVNNSVHAMMAMGFSNEGGWLTQLLTTVNGNIPEALDLLSAAHK